MTDTAGYNHVRIFDTTECQNTSRSYSQQYDRESNDQSRRSRGRGQLSLSLIEAAVGALFILAVTMGFALGVPEPDTREPQLDLYAEDAATVLADEPPRHQGTTRLAEVVRSSAAFERERDALGRRVDRILDDNLMYRVETPHGTVGFRKPADAPVGKQTITTVNGDVTIWVWYA